MIDPAGLHPDSEEMQITGSPEEILDAIHQVKDSLILMLTATGADPAKTRQTARMLEIGHNYIWPVSKMHNTEDILAAAEHIPSPKMMEALCQTCLQHGATDADVSAARQAMHRFDRIATVSCGDRESFLDLMRGLSYDDVTGRQESTRKMAFRAQSSLWGVQARVNFGAVIHSPTAEDPTRYHIARVGGLAGLRRLRPTAWTVYRTTGFREDGSTFDLNVRPLDPELEGMNNLPLLRQFCSEPLPEIVATEANNVKRFDIASGPLGSVGAVDCVFGDLLPDFDTIYRASEDKHQSAMIDLQTPSELLMLDFFVHRDLPFQLPPEVMHLDRLNSPLSYNPDSNERSRLPLSAQVTRLAPGLAGCAVPVFTRYRSIVEYAFDRMGHAANDFVGFRFTMKYPTIPSSMLLSVTKPHNPNGD